MGRRKHICGRVGDPDIFVHIYFCLLFLLEGRAFSIHTCGAISYAKIPPVVFSLLTFTVLVIVHDVFQGHQEDFLPGLLKLALLLPVFHSFYLSPWSYRLCFSAVTVVVEEGLVIEEGGGLKFGEDSTGPGQPRVEKDQRIRTCKTGEDSDG